MHRIFSRTLWALAAIGVWSAPPVESRGEIPSYARRVVVAGESNPARRMLADWETESAAFARTMTCVFERASLSSVLAEVGKAAELPVSVDWRRLAEEEIFADAEVSLRLGHVSVDAVLAQLMRLLPVRVSAAVRDGAIFVTTREFADSERLTCVYDIRTLIHRLEGRTDPRQDRVYLRPVGYRERVDEHGDRVDSEEFLIDMIERAVWPDAWHSNGGVSGLSSRRGVMVVSDLHAEGHRDVLRLLDGLETALSGDG